MNMPASSTGTACPRMRAANKLSMHLSLACKDAGAKDCSYIAKGETNEEVVQRMSDHMMKAHPEMIEGKSPDSVMEAMTPKIKATAEEKSKAI